MKYKTLTDRKKSICLFLLVFISYALIYTTKNCFSAAMASIVDDGIMTKSETGLISAAFYLVYAPFQIVGGIAADKYPPDRLIVIGTLGAAVANLLIYFVDSYIGMMIIWSANAIIQFGVWPAIFKIITTQLVEGHRHQGVFYISMASTIGLVFSYVSAAVIDYWKDNFLFSALLLFAVTIVFAVIYKRIERRMVDVIDAAQGATQQDEKKEGNLRLIFSAGIPLLMIVNMIHSMLNLGIKALAPTMLMESYPGITPSFANILNIVLILAGPLGLLLSGIPVFRNMRPTTALAIFLCAMLPMLGVIMFIGDVPLLLVMLALALIMVAAGAMSVLFSYISRSFQKFDCVATLSGLFNCMASLGIVLANYCFASLADTAGWVFTARCWGILAAFALLLSLTAIPVWSKFIKKNNIR